MSHSRTAVSACGNCKTPLVDRYCAKCGQRDLGLQLTFETIFNLFLHPLIEWDFRLWRTIKQLTLNPGKVALEYVSGKRASYVSPIKYCIVALAVGFAFSMITGELDAIQQHTVELSGGYATTGDQTEKGAEAQKFITMNANLMLFGTLPVLALFLRFFYWSAHRNYIENLCFIFFVSGHFSVLGLILTFSNMYVYFLSFWPSQLLIFFMLAYGSSVFYAESLWKVIPKTIAVMFVQLFLSVAVGNVIYFSYLNLAT